MLVTTRSSEIEYQVIFLRLFSLLKILVPDTGQVAQVHNDAVHGYI